MRCQGIQTPDPPRSVPQLPGYPPEEHLASLVGYLECPLGEPLRFVQGITTWMAGLFGAWGFAAPARLFGAWRFAAPAGLFGACRSAAPAGLYGAWTFAGACWTPTGVPGINIGRARWFIAEIFAGGCRYLGPKRRTFRARGFAGPGGGGLF